MTDSAFYRRQRLSLFCLVLTLSVSSVAGPGAARGQEADAPGEQPADVPAYLIKIPLPITGSVDGVVKRKADQLLERLPRDPAADAPRPVLVFEFGLDEGDTGKGSEFERALALARYLSSRKFSGVRTVAYLPHGVQGHALLAVLACDQIIMHPEAELGQAGVDEESIDLTMRSVYRGIALHRRLIDETVVAAMLDPKLEAYRVVTIKEEVRYVLAEEYQKLDDSGQVQSADTIVLPDQLASFTGEELRDKYQFVSHLVRRRSDLARALEIPSGVIEEDPALDKAWKAVLLELDGPTDGKSIGWVQKSIQEKAADADTNLLIIRINSTGGDFTQSSTLANTLAGLDSNRIRSVAYVPEQAKGDAMLVALACDHLIVGQDAILGGPGDIIIHDKDEQAAILHTIQEIAEKKSRDWSLSAALLLPQQTVHRYSRPGPYAPRIFSDEELAQQEDSKRWKKGAPIDTSKGLTGGEAESLKLARAVVAEWDEVKQLYHLEEEPERLKPNWAHSTISEFARKLDNDWLKRSLLFIAFIALMSEASSPGLGLPGFISAVCFALFFWIQILNGNAFWLEVLLFMVGIAFLGMEIFVIPGFGIFGIGGALMVVISIILASQTFVIPHSGSEFKQLVNSLTMVLVSGAGIVVALFTMRHMISKAPILRRLMLSPPAGEQLDDIQQRESIVDYAHLVGQRGITTTRLTPSGKAQFDGLPVDVISDGDLIPKGTQVQVVEVSGNRIEVRQVTEKSPTA